MPVALDMPGIWVIASWSGMSGSTPDADALRGLLSFLAWKKMGSVNPLSM